MRQQNKISLTAIFVEEKNGYTAFFAQFPNIIAEGDNKDEATENLFKLIGNVFDHLKREELKATETGAGKMNVTTESFELASIQFSV